MDNSPRVIGFVLSAVPGLEYTYIPATPGLTVLYGLNGAGKSRILNAISSIWTGEKSGAAALVQLPPARKADYSVFSLEYRLVEAWKPSALVKLDFLASYVAAADFEAISEEALDADLQPIAPDLPDPFHGPLPDGWVDEVRQEMLAQRLILITPDGTSGSSSWTVSHAAMEDTKYPAITAELRRGQDDYRMFDEDVDATYLAEYHRNAEDQWLETAALLDFGNGQYSTYGPLIGVPVRASDRNAEFRFAHVGLARFDPTRDDLRGQLKDVLSRIGVWDDEAGAVTSGVHEAVRLIEDAANERYGSILIDAPRLELRVRPVSEWWSNDPIRWTFGPQGLPLEAMSRAERHWADWAIANSIHAYRYRDEPGMPSTLLLLDEPEAALHRSAEAHMARALDAYSTEAGRHVIVASHSPELIGLSDACLLEVKRHANNGKSAVAPLQRVDLEALGGLGLTPSDLLRRQRGFLLVEGQHDEILLRAWIGRELEELRVELLPLRGGRKLPGTIESRVLFDFTDAHLFVVLDNVDAEDIRSAWLDAEARYLADGAAVASEQLRGRLGSGSDEAEWLAQWLSRALERGRQERVTPYGLRQGDIIEYLPAHRLVPGASDWPSLRQEYAKAREAGAPQKDFKKWLNAAKKAHFDADSIQSAARDTPTPAELEAFLDLVRQTVDGLSSMPDKQG